MGQEEVYQLLLKEKRWLHSTEIRKLLECSSCSFNRALKILSKTGDIIRKEARNVEEINSTRGYAYLVK